MKNKVIIVVIIFVALFVGFFFGRLLASDNITTSYSCSDITDFYADLLIRKYNIHDSFNTDITNPNRVINQKAADELQKVLTICNSDLTR